MKQPWGTTAGIIQTFPVSLINHADGTALIWSDIWKAMMKNESCTRILPLVIQAAVII